MPPKYTHTNTIKEHHGKPIFCVTFNTYDPANQDLVASVGGHQATVYRCHAHGRIEVLQVYVDDHTRRLNDEPKGEEEEFFCCKWTIDRASHAPLLLLAGKLALLRVVNCSTNTAVQTLKGHGKEVNDISVHQQHPHLILTASKDHSIRLWNIATGCCVLLMRGPGAHAGEVFTLDFHPWDPFLFVSGAMEGAVKVWSLKVFQAFPNEAWGVYAARDTAWMPGSLQALAGHMWNASRDNTTEVALMNWTWPIGLGIYNAFGLTRAAVGRFGLFDENIYPAFFEDNDFQLRQARMQPPMRVQVLQDVVLMHGKPSESSYESGVHTADDPNDKQREDSMRSFWQQRFDVTKAYLLRKWGCVGANWHTCAYKTPFNKLLPVWYWHTSKHQRALDYGLSVRDGKMVDGDGNLVYELPKDDNYSGWAGYNETSHVCRVTGPVGMVARNSSGLWCV